MLVAFNNSCTNRVRTATSRYIEVQESAQYSLFSFAIYYYHHSNATPTDTAQLCCKNARQSVGFDPINMLIQKLATQDRTVGAPVETRLADMPLKNKSCACVDGSLRPPHKQSINHRFTFLDKHFTFFVFCMPRVHSSSLLFLPYCRLPTLLHLYPKKRLRVCFGR